MFYATRKTDFYLFYKNSAAQRKFGYEITVINKIIIWNTPYIMRHTRKLNRAILCLMQLYVAGKDTLFFVRKL